MPEYYEVRYHRHHLDTFPTLEKAKEHVAWLNESYQKGYIGGNPNPRIYLCKRIDV